MKILIKYLSLTFLIIFAVLSCSKLEDDIAPPVKPSGVHPEGFGKPGAVNFHSVWFEQNNWNLKYCQQCHAADYGGGTSGESCLTCHTETAGPEACNTCHGDFSNPERISPPRDLSGNIETSARGVGSHSAHVYENGLTENIDCFECHPSETGSNEKYVYAHVGNPPADIEFGKFSSPNGNSEYDYNLLTCSNVYCHGNFSFSRDSSQFTFYYSDSVITGEKFSPVWNKVDGTQAACGTCHLLPPRGHKDAGTDPDATTCSSCHPKVVDANGNIIDRSRHINGMKDVF